MQSALIVHSRHTRDYAKLISRKYRDVEFLQIKKPPTEEILNIKSNKDIVIAIGGGSVMDVAKIISKEKRCIAIPTTASGADVTPYATVWGRKKISIPTKKPILRRVSNITIKLPPAVRQWTTSDALSHAIESFWSKEATVQSKKYSKRAISSIINFLKNNNTSVLIAAGNLAGKAIAIAKTNVIHAASYPLTIKYGIDHGAACGMLLPYFVEYMDFKGLPRLFNLDSTAALVSFLKKVIIPVKIKKFNARLIAEKVMKYDKIKQGPKSINKKSLLEILKNIIFRLSL